MIIFQDVDLEVDNKIILSNFNLLVAEKQKIIFTAPSGSGKSTVFKMILGFIRPNKGHVMVKNELITAHSIKNIRKQIAYVSQDVDFRDITVNELYLEVSSYKTNKRGQFNKEKFLELIDYFELDNDILNKKTSALSGGERQRMGLILACLLDREIWLLDEVTSGLDERLKRKVIEYIVKLDKTILVISHDKIWSEYHEILEMEWRM